MKKFILISFGFMGWAFYEMSGGDDFEPASVRMSRLNPEPQTEQANIGQSSLDGDSIIAEAQPETLDTDPPVDTEVSRVSLNLASLKEVLNATDQPAEDTTREPADTTAIVERNSEDGVPHNVGAVTTSADTPAIMPSLITPTTETVSSTPAESADTLSADIRTVSGNRVNVRGGPSTDFGIVTRLERGDAVQVLEDNGAGWVRMRPIEGGQEGWMADFLLTNG